VFNNNSLLIKLLRRRVRLAHSAAPGRLDKKKQISVEDKLITGGQHPKMLA